MKTISVLVCLGLIAPMMHAQETNDVQQLKQQLQQLQENFEKVQREQKEQLDSVTRKLDDLLKEKAAAAEKLKLEQELAASMPTSPPAASPNTPAASWSAAQPLTVARAGSAYMNI